MPEEHWYVVRTLIRFANAGHVDGQDAFEERITLWRAESSEEAILMSEGSAAEYVKVIDGQVLDLSQSYQLFDEPGHGAEVFSLVRSSSRTPEKYIDTFFDTGDEHQGGPFSPGS